jgi:hypothetical protein
LVKTALKAKTKNARKVAKTIETPKADYNLTVTLFIIDKHGM